MKNTKTNTLPKGLQNVLTKLDTVMSDDYQPAETALDRVLFAETAQETTDTADLKARIAELEAENATLQARIRELEGTPDADPHAEWLASIIRCNVYNDCADDVEELCDMAGLTQAYAAANDDDARWEVAEQAARILGVRINMTEKELCNCLMMDYHGPYHFSGETLETLNAVVA